MSLNFGKGNLSIAYNPTSAFPVDARTYFEDIPGGKTAYEQALEAAEGAEEVGSTNTKYYYGMKLLVKEGEDFIWYQISKNKTLIKEAEAPSRPQVVESEAEMNEILSNATETSIGTVYKYVGPTTNTYEQGALYILSGEIPDGDNVRYR